MQKVFEITNRYSILLTPLILFSLISTIYIAFSLSGGKFINLIFTVIILTLMTAAFISGWLFMVKTAVEYPETDEPNLLIKHFMSGIGEYFISSLVALIIIFTLFIFMFIGTYFVGINVIGNPNIATDALSEAMKNTTALSQFASSLTKDQLLKLNAWNFLLMGGILLTYFLTFLYMPALFFKNKNPFKAFFISLKDLVSKKIINTFLIFILIIAVNCIISVLTTIFNTSPILYFILTLLNFYFITIATVGIFYYYYQTFVKPLIGQNIDLKI